MTQPFDAPHTTATRRKLLAGSTIGAALVAVGVPALASGAVQPDPILALYHQWRALEDVRVPLERQHAALRVDFVDRYGERLKVEGASTNWERDPRHPVLEWLFLQVNETFDKSTELLEAMMERPATSLQGVHCKLLATVSVMEFIERRDDEPEAHEDMALAALRDAVRVIGSGVV